MSDILSSINAVISALSNKKMALTSEKALQEDIAVVLSKAGISFVKEKRLDERSIIDFLESNGIGIEIKIGGQRKEIYKQCERYAKIEEVCAIVLVTNKSIGWPPEINGKPTCVVNLGRAWL